MSQRYLGTTVDLHGGGSDLVYPHHESERAQSESANGRPFVRRWVHAGMVRHEGEKMSKSLGNLVFPQDLFRDVDPAAVRLALLGHHWRSSWEYDAGELKHAAERLEAWRRAGHGAEPASLPEEVAIALADDLDTPSVLGIVDELAAAGNGGAVVAAAEVLGVLLEPA
jgi:L-cysteine:1D-myo-inositol 2-amino-2-deoxy-alpha-D-glucopyranoside ligase